MEAIPTTHRLDEDAYKSKQKHRMNWLQNEYLERKEKLRKLAFDLSPSNRGIDYKKTQQDFQQEEELTSQCDNIEAELICLYEVLNINVNSQIKFES